MIQLNHRENDRNLSLPCTEKELQIFCDSLGTPNDADTKIRVGHSHNNPKVDELLAGKEVRLDELNYLMKRLDSFDEGEMNTFCAAASGQKLSGLKDKSLDAVTWSVEEHSLPDNLANMVITDKADFSKLNQFAVVFKNTGNGEVTALSELAAFAKITTSEQLKILADCMYGFESLV